MYLCVCVCVFVCLCVCVCVHVCACVCVTAGEGIGSGGWVDFYFFFYEILCFRAFMSSVRFRCRYQCILVLLCNIVVHGQLLRGSL